MPLHTSPLPQPTTDSVKSAAESFDQSQIVVERALEKLFHLFPGNTAPENVLLKVVALNDLYRTGILATYQVAQHIIDLEIDPLLQDGRTEAVEMIAQVKIGDKTRKNYSFATKYCSWHNPIAYPIFDSYVERILWDYQLQDSFSKFQRGELRSYPRFRQVIIDFRAHYHLTEFDLKDIDKFLWSVGKEIHPVSWKTKTPKGKENG
jgi:hypothetical protein